MGTRNPLPSERNRNLDFTILNKEAVGPAFLALNLERTRGGDRDSGLPRMWAAQFAVNPFFFFSFSTAHSELQFPCIYRAKCSLGHFLLLSSFRARRALWGYIAGYRNPAHFTSHLLAVPA